MPVTRVLTAPAAHIPAIGFGTSGLGTVRAEHIATALKAGYRHIDTARKYGTEPAVGEGMRASGVPRSEIFVCTKVSHENLHAADFARSVDASLESPRSRLCRSLAGALAGEKYSARGNHGRARQDEA